MPALKSSYVCHCDVPVPKMHMGQDTGLCTACNSIYDENLYEMRLREHTPNYTYADLDEFMRAVSPEYASA